MVVHVVGDAVHFSRDDEENTRWENFVESIKSKLTVKQVVDGKRAQ